MINDRRVVWHSCASRLQVRYKKEAGLYSDFVKRLATPSRLDRTLLEYTRLTKAKQVELKDVGGFVFADLKGGRRRNDSVLSRDVVTLDLDNIEAGGLNCLLQDVELLGCHAVVYSTLKHEPAKPRVRVLILLDRTCTPDEYEPLARFFGDKLDIRRCDPTTFEVARMMFFPAVLRGSEYVIKVYDKPLASVDGILSTYKDWKDISSWPTVPGHETQERTANKQQPPVEKKGVVGSFCRAYNIVEAMERFMPDRYTLGEDGRYTYIDATTSGGGILYGDGQFLYSHHATDPCSGQLVNSFDMVRLHLFGDMDESAEPNLPINRRPSFASMQELANSDEKVRLEREKERHASIAEDFGEVLNTVATDIEKVKTVAQDTKNKASVDWTLKLKTNKEGTPISNTYNVALILGNDSRLGGQIYYDAWRGMICTTGQLPWLGTEEGTRTWTDSDDSFLRAFLENYNIKGTQVIDDALTVYAHSNPRHEVKDYLKGLVWDGNYRLDSLFIDYLGAKDSKYVRAVTRKMFVAAVARVFESGTKFDQMCVLVGPQGIGKSSILEFMGGSWYTDGLGSFEDKKRAVEVIKNYLIVEIAELQALNKSDMDAVKGFLSSTKDDIREAYARRAVSLKRRQVFFGTTNEQYCLANDPTGNRRFWVIDCAGLGDNAEKIFSELPVYRDQLWAEAVYRYNMGEGLLLNRELMAVAKREQDLHEKREATSGIIEEFIARKVPEDWLKMGLRSRLDYWDLLGEFEADESTKSKSSNLIDRDRVCAMEVYLECLRGRENDNNMRGKINYINSVIKATGDWEESCPSYRFGNYYGRARGWVRKAL